MAEREIDFLKHLVYDLHHGIDPYVALEAANKYRFIASVLASKKVFIGERIGPQADPEQLRQALLDIFEGDLLKTMSSQLLEGQQDKPSSQFDERVIRMKAARMREAINTAHVKQDDYKEKVRMFHSQLVPRFMERFLEKCRELGIEDMQATVAASQLEQKLPTFLAGTTTPEESLQAMEKAITSTLSGFGVAQAGSAARDIMVDIELPARHYIKNTLNQNLAENIPNALVTNAGTISDPNRVIELALGKSAVATSAQEAIELSKVEDALSLGKENLEKIFPESLSVVEYLEKAGVKIPSQLKNLVPAQQELIVKASFAKALIDKKLDDVAKGLVDAGSTQIEIAIQRANHAIGLDEQSSKKIFAQFGSVANDLTANILGPSDVMSDYLKLAYANALGSEKLQGITWQHFAIAGLHRTDGSPFLLVGELAGHMGLEWGIAKATTALEVKAAAEAVGGVAGAASKGVFSRIFGGLLGALGIRIGAAAGGAAAAGAAAGSALGPLGTIGGAVIGWIGTKLIKPVFALAGSAVDWVANAGVLRGMGGIMEFFRFGRPTLPQKWYEKPWLQILLLVLVVFLVPLLLSGNIRVAKDTPIVTSTEGGGLSPEGGPFPRADYIDLSKLGAFACFASHGTSVVTSSGTSQPMSAAQQAKIASTIQNTPQLALMNCPLQCDTRKINLTAFPRSGGAYAGYAPSAHPGNIILYTNAFGFSGWSLARLLAHELTHQVNWFRVSVFDAYYRGTVSTPKGYCGKLGTYVRGGNEVPQETFAEAAAMYIMGDTRLKSKCAAGYEFMHRLFSQCQ